MIIVADSLVDLLIKEIDSDHVIEADSLVNLLIEEIDSDLNLNRTEFDDTDYFNLTDSWAFEREKFDDSLAINDHMFSLILLIKWIDATEWAIDFLAIQQSCRWFYWLSDVVLSFEVINY